MERFTSYDGTAIGYRAEGMGPPLVCLPGGPGRTGEYLGDLGGLAASRRLIVPDARGTGASAGADPASYRCDRLVADVEALRAQLGLDRMDLLGHSAAGDVATLYAAAHPGRLGHLILLTPSLSALGIEQTPEQMHAAMERRSGEPWYPAARAAVERAEAGDDSLETRQGYMPFLYGRWDDAAQAHSLLGVSERGRAFRDGYYAEGAFDPAATKAALAPLAAPVLIYAGDADIIPTPEMTKEAAGLFPHAELAVQPGAGHFPWLDDPAWFVAAAGSFLG